MAVSTCPCYIAPLGLPFLKLSSLPEMWSPLTHTTWFQSHASFSETQFGFHCRKPSQAFPLRPVVGARPLLCAPPTGIQSHERVFAALYGDSVCSFPAPSCEQPEGFLFL